MKKLSADLDGPKYNTPFEIVGFQALTEKGKYTELIEVIIENKITLKNRKDYLKWKEETGKEICNAYNSMLKTKWIKIVSFKIKYFLDPENHYI